MTKIRKQVHVPCLLLLAVMIAAGAWLSCWTMDRIERQMRDTLRNQTKWIAESINHDYIRTLSGSETDLDTPVYLRLKQQLAQAKEANGKCRFLYLMGQRPDGKVFFYVDNEPVGSNDESPAGQIYEEISHGADLFGVSRTFMMQIAFLVEFQKLNRKNY